MKGLIHIYTGDGKGKTTAALGLAIRAAGRNKRVLFVQFFKGGDSGELLILKNIPNIDLLRLTKRYGFYKDLTEKQKSEVYREHTDLLCKAIQQAQDGACDLLILDEVISAYQHSTLDRAALAAFLENKPRSLELVLTGRNAPEQFIAMADYVTEMRKIKHPYESGTAAREGIEF